MHRTGITDDCHDGVLAPEPRPPGAGRPLGLVVRALTAEVPTTKPARAPVTQWLRVQREAGSDDGGRDGRDGCMPKEAL